MPIRLVCPSCSTQLSVKDEFAGRAVRCPKCSTVIPGSKPAASPPPPPPPQKPKPSFEVVDEPAKPASPSRPVAKALPSKPAARANNERDDDDDRPRRKSSAGGKRPPAKPNKILPIILTTIVVLWGLGAFFTYKVMTKATQQIQDAVREIEKKKEEQTKGGDSNPRATSANFDKVKLNMTREEVEAILGPGTEASAADLPKAFNPRHKYRVEEWTPKAGAGRVLMWRNRNDTILVCLHAANGRVQMKDLEYGLGAANSDGWSDDDVFPILFDSDAAIPKPEGNLVVVKAHDLARRFRETPAIAHEEFKNKWLRIEGEISILSWADSPLGRGCTVRLQGLGTGGTDQIDVLAGAAPEAIPELLNCSDRQSITVVGKYVGFTERFVGVAFCTLAAKGNDPAVAATADAFLTGVEKDRKLPANKSAGFLNKRVCLTSVVIESVRPDGQFIATGRTNKSKFVIGLHPQWKSQGDAIKPGDVIKIRGSSLIDSGDEKLPRVGAAWVVPDKQK